MVSQRMLQLGTARSVIRELFEFGKARAAQVGAENVFDFSLGNPSIPAPEEVRQDAEGMQTMRILGRNMAFFLKCKESALAHGLGLPTQEPFQFTNFVR